MNIIILKWVLTNFTLLKVAQPDVTQTTVEMLQSDWAATIVKTNPDIGLKPYLPSGTVGLRPTKCDCAIMKELLSPVFSPCLVHCNSLSRSPELYTVCIRSRQLVHVLLLDLKVSLQKSNIETSN